MSSADVPGAPAFRLSPVLKGDARVKLHCLLVAQLRGARPGTTRGGSAWTDERVTRASVSRAHGCAPPLGGGAADEKKAAASRNRNETQF